MARLVTEKERNLILNSDILKDYPKFKEFLENTPTLDDSEIGILDEDMRNFFIGGIFNAVKGKAPKEWEVDKSKTLENDEEEPKNCQICNHPIKNLYYIKNKMNGKYMVVGSICVNHFGILDKNELDKLLKERAIIKRREEINKAINNIEKTFRELELFIEKSPIIIKNKIIKQFMFLKNEASSLHKKYIESDLENHEKNEIINKIKEILSKIKVEEDNINEYIDKNKNNKFVATKNIFKSIDYDDKSRIDLEEEGFISDKNIFRIKDSEFIKSLIDDFNNYLMDYNMKIIGIYESSRDIYYQIDIGNRGFTIVDYKYKDFAFNYGSLLFGEQALEDINVDNIFKNSIIRSDETIKTIIESIEQIIEKRSFQLNDVNKQFDEIIIKNCKNDRYIIIKLSETIEKFKDLALDTSKKLEREVISYILSHKDTKSESEMSRHKRITNL